MAIIIGSITVGKVKVRKQTGHVASKGYLRQGGQAPCIPYWAQKLADHVGRISVIP